MAAGHNTNLQPGLYIAYLPVKKQLEKKIKNKETSGLDKMITKVKTTWNKYKEAFDEEFSAKAANLREEEIENLSDLISEREDEYDQLINNADCLLHPKEKETKNINQNTQIVTAGDVGKQIGEVLAKIPVSKQKFNDYKTQLKQMLVSDWTEESATKMFTGVEVDSYDKFLEKFQKNTGISNEVMQVFEMMPFTDRMDDKVKVFNSGSGLKNSGSYGMYAAVRHGDKIDVAYAMYKFSTEFVEDDKNTMLGHSSAKSLSNEGSPESSAYFNQGAIDELGENFIVAKALQAFTHAGVIPAVTWREDPDVTAASITEMKD